MSRSVFFSDQLQASFEADGIVCVSLLNESEIASLLEFYKVTSKGIAVRKFHSTMFVSDADYRKQTDRGIKKIIHEKVNSLIDSYRMLFANFIVKEPSVDTRVGIHQDWNFTSPEFTSVNVWIPLVDINEETGLFYALKGSHHNFRNIRYTPYEDNAYSALENFIYENASSFRVTAGTAIIYHGALVHFSDPNVSNDLRIAVGAALIPEEAPNLHYYKRERNSGKLEVYEVNDVFYNGFDFFNEPRGVKQIGDLEVYAPLPTLDELLSIAR